MLEQIYKNRTCLSLLNCAFDIMDQKMISLVVTSLPSLGQGETGSDFSELYKCKLHH